MSQNKWRETLTSAWQRIRAEAETLQAALRCQDLPPQDRHKEPVEWLTRELKQLTAQLHWELITAATTSWLERYPNIGIHSSTLARMICDRHGNTWFDQRAIEVELEQEYGGDRARKLAWEVLVAKARWLVPIQVTPADLLRNRETLRLQCWLERDSQASSRSWLTHDVVRQIRALTQIACVLQDGADPATVKSSPQIQSLADCERCDTVTGRWWSFPPLRFRFYRNGRLDVRCETVELAQKLADTLASSPSGSPDEQEDQERACATATV